MDTVWLILYILSCLAGVLLVVLQLPGTWAILVFSLLYDWSTGFTAITPPFLIAMGVLSLAGELIEMIPSVVLARKAGASRRASICSLLGGFAGMILFTPLIPIPVIGTIAGAIIGCFAGAMIAELTVQDSVQNATRVGFAAAIGRTLGTVGKLAIGLIMLGLAIVSLCL